MPGKKSLDKVKAARVKRPLATARELAPITGLSKATVARCDNEILRQDESITDNRIHNLLDTDVDIMTYGAAELFRRLSTPEIAEKMPTRDIVQATAESAKRRAMFTNDGKREGDGYDAFVGLLCATTEYLEKKNEQKNSEGNHKQAIEIEP
jgi:hypothetical protein